MKELHTQHRQKLNVWEGLLGNHIIGPFFIDGSLTGPKYKRLLENQVLPRLRELNVNIQEIWFQQDGAPPHYSEEVRTFLNRTFLNRWIGRRGGIEWPARSLDLTPLDFFFLGTYEKSSLYG